MMIVNIAEEVVAEPEREIYAAIAAFLYEENEENVTDIPVDQPSLMDPWKLLARQESVG